MSYKPLPDSWLEAAKKELKGASPEETLVVATPDNIKIKPLYTQDDLPSEVDQIPGIRELLKPSGAYGIFRAIYEVII